jgi:uncharacterized HAD superfamily protein
VACRTCGGKVDLKVRECKLYLECTVAKRAPGVASCCAECTSYAPAARPIRWVRVAELAADALVLASKLPLGLIGIVGLPRSGMIPAAIIATHLHLPLYELTHEGKLNRLGNGSRGRWFGFPAGPPHVLAVVDDTAYSGAAMARARRAMGDRTAVYGVVYLNPAAAAAVDFFARELQPPHVLEWNLFNAGSVAGRCIDREIGVGVACDFDGVLCRNPTVPDADHGPRLEAYVDWLQEAPPLFLPRVLPVPLIVTGRLERWRAKTEQWLLEHRVLYQRLVMHPASCASERDRAGDIAAIKAREYAASGCGLFFESEDDQAETIWRLSGKPVVAVGSGRVFQ